MATSLKKAEDLDLNFDEIKLLQMQQSDNAVKMDL